MAEALAERAVLEALEALEVPVEYLAAMCSVPSSLVPSDNLMRKINLEKLQSKFL